ncbi:MAG: dockerin type I repeat-containing protein [Actinomycetota bacterium]
MIGDVNCDSQVDIVDALLIAQYAVSLRIGVEACPLGNPTSEIVVSAGELDGSGGVDVVDALLLAQCATRIGNIACPTTVIDIDEPVTRDTLGVLGADGFVPVIVGERVYLIAHHSTEINCISLDGELCWPERTLYDGPEDATSMNVTHPHLVGDRIHHLLWLGDTGQFPSVPGELILTCWDTSADARCSSSISLGFVGHAVLYGTTEALYVFAANQRVYCFEPADYQPCVGYDGGLSTAIDDLPLDRPFAWNSDRVALNGKVYVTLAENNGVWLHCWDTTTASPCSGFTPSVVNGSEVGWAESWTSGRLFLARDTAGVPIAMCSVGRIERVDCVDLGSGAPEPVVEQQLAPALADLSIPNPSFIGVTTYDPATNREIFVGGLLDSMIACFDYTVAGSCGEMYVGGAFGPAHPYGYVPIDECHLGGGHAGVVHWIRAEPFGLCVEDVLIRHDIERSDGIRTWPRVRMIDADGLYRATLRVLDPGGDQLWPEHGLAEDLLQAEVDLALLLSDDGAVTIEVEVTVDPTENPWSQDPPYLLLD